MKRSQDGREDISNPPKKLVKLDPLVDDGNFRNANTIFKALFFVNSQVVSPLA